MRGGRRAGLLRVVPVIAVLPLVTSCAAFPGAPSAGRRLWHDLKIVITSPVQVPAMAARDAWRSARAPALRPLAFPATFLVETAWHSGLALLHLADLSAAPLHLFNDLEPVAIYEPGVWPTRVVDDADVMAEAGTVLCWAAGTWGGAAVAYWFGAEYLPRALSL